MPLTAKQSEYIEAVRSRKYLYLLYGGGVGGGKSIVQLGFADEMCMAYPGIRVSVLRKTLVSIRRNTIPSFKKVQILNNSTGFSKLNKSEWKYVYSNGSEILFIEANDETDPEFNKLRGLEITFVIIEECNELIELAFNVLITRTGRWLNKEYNIPPLILLNCNPSDNWVKNLFYTPWSEKRLRPPYYFLSALAKDNRYLTSEYLAALEHLPEPIYKCFVEGEWDFASNPKQLIQFQWLKNGQDEENEESPKYLGIDAGGEGDDPTVLCFGNDKGVCWYEVLTNNNPEVEIEIIKARMDEYLILPDMIAVDIIGLGAGITTGLSMLNINIKKFNASESPAVKDKEFLPVIRHFVFLNKRAEAAWLLREDIRKNDYTICDNRFIKEALAVNYDIKNGKIVLEGKFEIKKKIKKSPDFFDSTKIMNYVRRGFLGGAVSFVELADRQEKQINRTAASSSNFRAGMMSSKLRY